MFKILCNIESSTERIRGELRKMTKEKNNEYIFKLKEELKKSVDLLEMLHVFGTFYLDYKTNLIIWLLRLIEFAASLLKVG